MKQKFIIILFTILLIIGSVNIYSNGTDRFGTIKGRIIDKDTRNSVPGATLRLKGDNKIILSGINGEFIFPKVRVGTHSILINLEGIISLVKTDIIVKSRKTTFLYIEYLLKPNIIQENITVEAEYFTPSRINKTSSTNFSAEEIRRAPGSAGDVSRVIYQLPSIAKVNDQVNSLIVRGGNPFENVFFLDNIEISNINHFPTPGSSGGPISLLNMEMIDDVDFHAGGFSSIYGDKLSAIMDINYREGNRDEFETQIDFNMAGFGLLSEGPLTKKGSWILSVRKSFLELLTAAIGTSVPPTYGDIQSKIVFDITPRNKISFLGILGLDKFNTSAEESKEEGRSDYMQFKSSEYTVGINWLSLWSNRGYSETSLSLSRTKFTGKFFKTKKETLFFDNDSVDESLTLRNVNNYSFNYANKIQFGFDLKNIKTIYKYSIAADINPVGDYIPAISLDSDITAQKYSSFINYSLKLFSKLELNLGIRGDYFSYTDKIIVSPRFSFSFDLSNRTKLIGSTGIYYQNLPLILLYQDVKFKELESPKAIHFVLGLEQLLSKNTKLTIELFSKDYKNLPVNPLQPDLFMFDNLRGGFTGHSELNDSGKARSYGVEFTIQKKLRNKLYGMISGSYSRSQYRDIDDRWKNRISDNRFIFSVEGGYKPNKKMEFSLRWIYAGGIPYTPFDINLSTIKNVGILDKTQINELRMPSYQSLNLRFDKRYYYKKANLTFFVSIWNAYNRKNIAEYYWDYTKNMPAKELQWSMLPVAGFELEF